MPPSVLLTHPATTYLEAMQCFYARKSPPHLNSFAVVHSFHIGSDNDNLFTFFPSLSLWTVTNLNLDFETGPTIFRPASTGTRTEIEPLFDLDGGSFGVSSSAAGGELLLDFCSALTMAGRVNGIKGVPGLSSMAPANLILATVFVSFPVRVA
ncbi:hypothetical protein KCU88_g260, partial [Aureobasidium melanogenum]